MTAATARKTTAPKATAKKGSEFARGSGCFTCTVCGKKTRSTGRGDNEHNRQCERCYDMAGDENAVTDGEMTQEAFDAKWKTAPKATARKQSSKKKVGAADTAPAIVTEQERELATRYKHQSIIPGSWRAAGGREGWGNKRTVEVRCQAPDCQHTRVLATSDLQWSTTKFCLTCVKVVKSNQRATKQEKKGKKAK